jgi:hypothetical protein
VQLTSASRCSKTLRKSDTSIALLRPLRALFPSLRQGLKDGAELVVCETHARDLSRVKEHLIEFFFCAEEICKMYLTDNEKKVLRRAASTFQHNPYRNELDSLPELLHRQLRLLWLL